MGPFLLSNSQCRGALGPEALLLGDWEMSAALSAQAGEEQASPGEKIGRALALLQEALELIDSMDASPEIGARLQEVIGDLDERDRAYHA